MYDKCVNVCVFVSAAQRPFTLSVKLSECHGASGVAISSV